MGLTELPFKPSFGCTEIARSAKIRSRFHADGPASRGDVFVVPSGPDTWGHIGIVTRYPGGVTFESVEGNTNTGGSFEGKVARRSTPRVARVDFILVGSIRS